jgi:signal transduction histidine kinase
MADDLYPQTLDYFGLTTAIERFVDSFKERHGIEVSVSIPPSLPRLPAKHELALYRVVEEALKNVLMHSGSKAAEVRVNYDAEEIELDVLDAGGGMPLSEEFAPGGNSKGTGIHEMQQRMRSIGGELLITSGRDGTKVIAVLPFVPRPSEVLA